MTTTEGTMMRDELAAEIDAEFDALPLADAIHALMESASYLETHAEETGFGPTDARRAARAIRRYARMLPTLHPPGAAEAA